MELERKQMLGVVGIVAALFGLLVFPFLVQNYLGIDAVTVTFAVIVFYAAISLYVNR
jgi:hypothetical protein